METAKNGGSEEQNAGRQIGRRPLIIREKLFYSLVGENNTFLLFPFLFSAPPLNKQQNEGGGGEGEPNEAPVSFGRESGKTIPRISLTEVNIIVDNSTIHHDPPLSVFEHQIRTVLPSARRNREKNP